MSGLGLSIGKVVERGASPLSRFVRRAALAIAALGVLSAAALFFIEIEHQLERSSVAQSDNTTWVLAQVEVDLLKFERALNDLRLARADAGADIAALGPQLAEVRLSFDILYSRIDVARGHHEVLELPLTQSAVWDEIVVDGGVRTQIANVVDAGDEAILANVDSLATLVGDISEPVRTAILKSLAARTEIGDAWRSDLREALQFFSVACLGLLSVMGLMTVAIYAQSQARARHAQALESAVFNLRTTLNASTNPVVVLDFQGHIQTWNTMAASVFGLVDADRSERRFSSLVRPSEGELSLDVICHMMQEGRYQREVGDRKLKMIGQSAGRPDFACEVVLVEAKGVDGGMQIIAFMRDMTEQMERERVLTEARNAAQRGEEAKARFLAVMSHEMRTPLNGLLSATELMIRTTDMDDRQRWLTGIIHSCGRATLEQVNNVLELTRLGANEGARYPAVPFSLVDTVRDMVALVEPDAMVRGNRLMLRDPVPFIPRVKGPRPLMQRILNNLLSNAIKFTENGRIDVIIDGEPGAEPGTYSIVVSVADTGIGIAEADLARIFRNFETLDSSYARMREGSGLGLGIAKLSAEAMGGRITVESRVGEGSVFTLVVTLPLAAEETETVPTPADATATAGLSVLVVEDNALNRHLLRELLRHHGHRVEVVEDGVEAVEITARRSFDVILMDVSMPRMDGLEATRRIRASGGPCAGVPIIAVTANANQDRVAEFLASGMTEITTKPVDISLLETTMRRVLGSSGAAVPSPETDGITTPALRETRPAPEPVGADDGATGRSATPDAGGEARDAEVKPQGAKILPGPKPKRRASAPAGKQPARPTASIVSMVQPQMADSPAPSADAVALLDEETMADLEEQLGREYMCKMTLRFADEADRALAELSDTEAEGDLPRAAQVAHKAAGAAAALGLKGLHRVLVTFENEAKAGQREAARERIARIEAIKADTFALLRDRGLIA